MLAALISRHIVVLKIIVHVLALLPVAWLYWQAVVGGLGADPVAKIIHFTGKGVLNLLLLTLLVSPLVKLAKLSILMRFRRLLGLYAFFYACLHLLSFAVFDLQLQWEEVLTEIVKRPYLTLGAFAFVCLLALAITSTQSMMRRLGRNWKRLHQLVYVAIVVGWIHFFWSVKSVQLEPLIYALLIIGVLSFRFPMWWKKLKSKKLVGSVG